LGRGGTQYLASISIKRELFKYLEISYKTDAFFYFHPSTFVTHANFLHKKNPVKLMFAQMVFSPKHIFLKKHGTLIIATLFGVNHYRKKLICKPWKLISCIIIWLTELPSKKHGLFLQNSTSVNRAGRDFISQRSPCNQWCVRPALAIRFKSPV
jgi:hypothetical protein